MAPTFVFTESILDHPFWRVGPDFRRRAIFSPGCAPQGAGQHGKRRKTLFLNDFVDRPQAAAAIRAGAPLPPGTSCPAPPLALRA
jgi:hypothetical protein